MNASATWPYHSGELAGLIKEYDWSKTSLGPIAGWPQTVKTAIDLMLSSPVAMVMLLGPDGIMVYNDAYSLFAGGRHPQLLGSPVLQGWPEVADFNRRVMETGFRNETLTFYDHALVLNRNGQAETVWLDLYYSPLLDEHGKPQGVLAIVVETTPRVLADEAFRRSEARLRFLGGLDEATRKLHDPREVMQTVTRMLAEHLQTTRCAYADVSEDGDHFNIMHDYVQKGNASTVGSYSLNAFGPRAGIKLRGGNTLVIRDVTQELKPGEGMEMFQSLGIQAVVCCPLVKEGELRALMAVHQSVPRDWKPEEIRLIEAVVERSWAYIERLRAVLRLRESEEFARSIIESSPDCVKVIGLHGELLSLNQSGCQQMEIDDVSLCLNTQWTQLWNGEERAKAERAMQEARAGQVSRFEGFCPTHKGAPKWWEVIVTPIRSADGEVTRLLCISRDITERRATQEAVREMQEHLSLMVESVMEFAIISMDRAGHIVSWNTGAQAIFGYEPAEVIGRHAAIIFTPEDRENDVPRQELATAERTGRCSDERWHVRKSGERFYVSGMVAAMYDGTQNIKGFIKVASDRTRQRQAEEALMEARNAAEAANIAKSEFLANMSHEIRTPMNAVVGLANILAASEPLTQKQRDFVRTLQMSADSLLSLINDLLDIAKIEARTVELEQVPFSITRLVQEVVSMMAVRVKEKGLEFTGSGDCVHRRMFIGDPTRLRQIILNLCSNAIKFTESGQVHVSITCHATDDPRVETVCISVEDTGIGIAPEKLENIFQKFVQADTSINRKYGGTGLGLAITKTLTEIMGGEITVKSELGKGSTFTVCVPLRVADSEDVADSSEALPDIFAGSELRSTHPTILLVEDYAPNVLVASTFLEYFGYASDVASNGLEAIEKIKAGNYSLVLMDVQMHGMNGLEATSLIREYERQQGKPHLTIIGMTAHAMAGDRERCISAGMDDYISKPFNPTELKDKLHGYLKRQ